MTSIDNDNNGEWSEEEPNFEEVEHKKGLCTDYRIGNCNNEDCPWQHRDCRFGVDCTNIYYRNNIKKKCPFGHPPEWKYSKMICNYYNTPRGCLYGDRCKKIHKKN